jgi:hypothetical protein
MKTLQRLAVVIIAIAGACSTQQYYWTHPEKDAEQFEADNSYCLSQTRGTRMLSRMPEYQGGQAGTFSSGWNTVPSIKTMEMKNDIHRKCMIDKGWHLEAE